MSALRILIADDEGLARQRIRDLLAKHHDVEISGECENATDTIRGIRERAPDLVFLDVQMPDGSGFDVLHEVGVRDVPTVIFTTAYDQYALQAFEAHALDYLLKPFSDERFERSLARARRQVVLQRESELAGRLEALLEDVRRSPDPAERLVVRSAGRVSYVDPREVEWVEAEGNYVLLHTPSGTHLHRETMGRLESLLPHGAFLRIHRSTIVQLALVKEVLRSRDGDCAVRMSSGKQLGVSPRHRGRLLESLERGPNQSP